MKYSVILIMLFSIIIANCGNTPYKKTFYSFEPKAVNVINMNFNSLIKVINKKVVDLTATSDLYSIDEFVHIYSNPTDYKYDALSYIADSSNDLQSKQIAIYSMQGLSDSLYIDFCGSMSVLFSQGIITEDLIEAGVFYSLNSKYHIIRNYNNTNVIKLVENVKVHTKNINLINRLNDLLNGKTWGKLLYFFEMNK